MRSLLATTRESLHTATKTQCLQKINKQTKNTTQMNISTKNFFLRKKEKQHKKQNVLVKNAVRNHLGLQSLFAHQ